MEMLNYSLWFTLVWWCFSLFVLYAIQDEMRRRGFKNVEVANDSIITMYIIVPAIAILLEYLIVR